LSPRAAWRLESLGFSQVYDYVPGKTDWWSAGLPIEGQLEDLPTIGKLARKDVPTCRLGERVDEVRQRAQEAGWDTCVVVNEERIVLGVLRDKAWKAAPGTTAEVAMISGPTSLRPDTPLQHLMEHQKHVPARVLVTDGNGALIGLLLREDLH
jgi:CBS domain-containing protein